MLEELYLSPILRPSRELVEPLLVRVRALRSVLARNLRAYFVAGANASEVADWLFLHLDSLLYCLTRIEVLTGLDLENPRTRPALQLGLLAIEGRSGKEPPRRNRAPITGFLV